MIHITAGVVFTQLKGLSSYERAVADKCTKYFVEGSQFSKQFKEGVWDGYVHLLNNRGIMPSGMLNKVLRVFRRKNIPYKLKDTRQYFRISSVDAGVSLPGTKRRLRPYQLEAVSTLVNKFVGTVVLPTGTGKTTIMAALAAKINKEQFLVIGSGTSILLQIKYEISNLIGEEVGYIGEGIWNPKRVTVTSADTMGKMLLPPPKRLKFKDKEDKFKYLAKVKRWKEQKPKALAFLSNPRCICVDEAHHGPSDTFKATLYACTNAVLRAGFTATYSRSSGDEMLLHAVTGGIVYKKSTSWMIRHGYLSRPVIILIPFEDTPFSRDREWGTYKEAYSEGIVHNRERNTLLADSAVVMANYGIGSIIFVQEVIHGENIEWLLKKRGLKERQVVFVTGNETGGTRQRILKAFRKGSIKVLICTRIFNEGIDIPEVGSGIKAGGQKYEGLSVQQLGRTLRKIPGDNGEIILKREERVFWVDPMDMHDEYLSNHALQRMSTYEKEKEYIIEIANNIAELHAIVKKHKGKVVLAA